jgi:DNA invertase Pin-like site-specific DNA recombinase
VGRTGPGGGTDNGPPSGKKRSCQPLEYALHLCHPSLLEMEQVMAQSRFVAYYRVSTDRQGRSGLGIEAQKAAVSAFLNGGNWSVIAEFVEVESGKRSDRPELGKALHLCRVHNATLVIAKLDRLARDAHFLLGLEKAGIEFVAADMPSANRLTVGIMAMVAEEERRMISARTKAALAAAKARGKKLGGARPGGIKDAERGRALGREARVAKAASRAADLRPIIEVIRAEGATSLRAIAAQLNARGIKPARGVEWQANTVKRVLDRKQDSAAEAVSPAN